MIKRDLSRDAEVVLHIQTNRSDTSYQQNEEQDHIIILIDSEDI
jgi:hypothetical protein